MRVEVIEIAGMNGIEIPDDAKVDSEFVLTVPIRVFSMERDRVDVTSYGGETDSLPGSMVVKAVALT